MTAPQQYAPSLGILPADMEPAAVAAIEETGARSAKGYRGMGTTIRRGHNDEYIASKYNIRLISWTVDPVTHHAFGVFHCDNHENGIRYVETVTDESGDWVAECCRDESCPAVIHLTEKEALRQWKRREEGMWDDSKERIPPGACPSQWVNRTCLHSIAVLRFCRENYRTAREIEKLVGRSEWDEGDAESMALEMTRHASTLLVQHFDGDRPLSVGYAALAARAGTQISEDVRAVITSLPAPEPPRVNGFSDDAAFEAARRNDFGD